jgi:hypothetical protein
MQDEYKQDVPSCPGRQTSLYGQIAAVEDLLILKKEPGGTKLYNDPHLTGNSTTLVAGHGRVQPGVLN